MPSNCGCKPKRNSKRSHSKKNCCESRNHEHQHHNQYNPFNCYQQRLINEYAHYGTISDFITVNPNPLPYSQINVGVRNFNLDDNFN